jgi:predicted RNase H-like nuclease (RuvC/YqgF family)
MTTIKLEILDNDEIDCEYYGYESISRIIQMSKPNGDLNKVLKKLHQPIKDISTLAYQIKNTQSTIEKLNKKIADLKQKISSDRRKLTIARKAIQQVQPTFNKQTLNNPEIAKNQKTLKTLIPQLEIHQKNIIKLQDAYDTLYEKDPLSTTIKTLIDKNIKITDQTIYSTVIGSTTLYDALIADNWTVDDPFANTINHLNPEATYTNGESIIITPKKPNVYRSKYNH